MKPENVFLYKRAINRKKNPKITSFDIQNYSGNLTTTTHSSFNDNSNKFNYQKSNNNSLNQKLKKIENLFLTNVTLDKNELIQNSKLSKRNVSLSTRGNSLDILKENEKKMKKKRESLHLLKIPELKQRFEKNKYNKTLTLFENYKKTNERISKKMFNLSMKSKFLLKNAEKRNRNNLDAEDILDISELEKHKNETKIATITPSGRINMITKSYVELMQFGDSYFKYNDVDFYNNSKEILKNYKLVRIKAKVKESSPTFFKSRLPILRHNQLKIMRKYNSIIREYIKTKSIANNYKEK